MPQTDTGYRIRARMTARSIDEPNRTAEPIELLFDLTFVIAVGALAGRFAHAVGEGDALAGLVPFLLVFFAVWWAWMNFTWFASAYDTGDAAYRLLTLLQMAGALVIAAGVPSAADDSDYRAVTLGYFIMRIALVAQWLRAGVEHPAGRRTALRYAAGIGILQGGWILRLVLTETADPTSAALPASFLGLAALELAVPWWAERAGRTSWHPHHIAERYSLFVIILFGENVFAASDAVGRALEAADVSGGLVLIAASGLVMMFALWWLYFLVPTGEALSERRHRSFLWGYGHYGVFAALAALGAGLEVAVEQTAREVEAAAVTVCYAVAVPVAAFVILHWLVHAPLTSEPVVHPAVAVPAVTALLLLPLAAPLTGVAAVIAALAGVCVLITAITVLAKAARPPRLPSGSH